MGDSIWKHHEEHHDNFFFVFLNKKVKSSWYFSSKNPFKTKFWLFLNTFRIFLKNFSFLKGFRNKIFNKIVFFSFQVKSVIPSVTGKNHSNYLDFMLLTVIFVVLQPFILLCVFHYFGHHRRLACQIFNLRLSFNYFNQAIILIKKNCALGVLRYGLGRKQPRLVILAT